MSDKLYQIEEPAHKKAHQKQAIGIDLGTTNSVVAFTKDSKISTLADKEFNVLHPSIVDFISKDGYPLTVKSIKRLMGKSHDEIINSPISRYFDIMKENGRAKLVTKDKNYTAEEISSLILGKLKKLFRESEKKEIEQAVITVPAFFSDIERQATKKAAELAGIKVLRLINEPTAALLAYGLENEREGNYIVYDLGGGTFDVSILKLVNNVFQVKATNGDLEIGGDDFDYLIAKHFNLETKAEFIEKAKELKHILTQKEEATVEFEGEHYILTAEGLYLLGEDLLNKTVEMIKEAVEESGLEECDGIVLVGGSTKMPAVKRKLEEMFEYKIYDDLNPETIVAKGAAIQADKLLNKNRDILLVDVNPISLGIETMGGIFERIIERNSPIPTAKSQNFTTFKDNQYSLKINIFQGERELVKDCRLLGTLILDNIPMMLAGIPRIRVDFILDENSILKVKALEETTGIEQIIKINSDLSSEDSLAILKDAIVHGKEDVAEKEFINSKVELEQVIQASKNLVNGLKEATSLEKEKMLEFIVKIEEEYPQIKNREELESKKAEIEEYFKEIVKENMNKMLDEYLVGKDI